MSAPNVSVIMNCLNGERYLREALDSVYAQTYSDWEIILWDNASTDGTAAIARGYDERLRYCRGERTIPLGAARNMALSEARGQYVAFLDSDDRWLAKKLELQIPLFDAAEVGIVFSDAYVFNQHGERYRFHGRMPFATGQCFRKLLSEYFLCMQTVVLRRKALDEEGELFDPRFEIIEEGDLFIRLAYRWRLAMVDVPLAEYRLHGESFTWTKGCLAADETEIMLNKLAERIPGFWTQYGREAAKTRMAANLKKGSYCLRTGDRNGARSCARPHIIQSRRAFMMFVASFLPELLLLPVLRRFLKRRIVAAHI